MRKIKEEIKKNEKGSITLFVLVAMLFFTIILILSYSGQMNKISSQRKQVEKIQEEYSADGDMENVYNQVINDMPITSIIKIGDYVAYTPQSTTTSYTFESKYSGYSSDQTKSQDSLKWRVLNVNENTIELISDTPTSSTVYFQGALGYNNGVYLLNEFCNTLYRNTEKGATARSLNIEDIEEKMDVSVWDYRSYTSETNTKYGDTYTNTANRYYPSQWIQEKTEKSKIDGNASTGESGRSEQTLLTEITSGQASTSIEVQQTYWYRSNSDIKSNFKKANTRSEDTTIVKSMYYELLCNNGTSNYWLASRYANTSSSTLVDFGLQDIYEGAVQGSDMFISDASLDSYERYVRPVVSLPISSIDITKEYNESTGWSLK